MPLPPELDSLVDVAVVNSKFLPSLFTSQVTSALLHLTQEKMEEGVFLTQEGGEKDTRMEVVVVPLTREVERMVGGDLSLEAEEGKLLITKFFKYLCCKILKSLKLENVISLNSSRSVISVSLVLPLLMIGYT